MRRTANGSESKVWRKAIYRGVKPSSRSGAGSVVVDGCMYVWGGYGGSTGRLDDFYRYSFEERTWQAIRAKGPSPAARENNGLVAFNKRMYLFGGFNGTRWLNDFHEFNIERGEWKVVDTKSRPPAPRFGFVSVVYKHKMILFGGYDGSSAGGGSWLNDMYEFDFLSSTWSCIAPKGQVPSIRSCPSWTTCGSSCFLLGGYDGVNRLSDFFELDMESYMWREIKPSPSDTPPSPRYFHSCHMNSSNTSLFVFGGYNGVERLNDLYEYSFLDKRWRVVPVHGEIPRGRSSYVSHVHGNTLFLLGGYNGHVVLDDFFEIRLEPVTIPPPSLSKDLRCLIDNKAFSDVTFLVDGREVHANRAVMAARSEHFQAMLYGHMVESRLPIIPLHDISHSEFLLLLEYLYCDDIDLVDVEMAGNMLVIAERFLLDRLKALCEDVLRKAINVDNVVSLYLVSQNHRALALKEICVEYLVDNMEAIKRSSVLDQLKLEPELLFEILMRSSRP